MQNLKTSEKGDFSVIWEPFDWALNRFVLCTDPIQTPSLNTEGTRPMRTGPARNLNPRLNLSKWPHESMWITLGESAAHVAVRFHYHTTILVFGEAVVILSIDQIAGTDKTALSYFRQRLKCRERAMPSSPRALHKPALIAQSHRRRGQPRRT